MKYQNGSIPSNECVACECRCCLQCCLQNIATCDYQEIVTTGQRDQHRQMTDKVIPT